MQLSGREKATIFLSILGPENSAAILRYLPGELADIIAAGLNHLPTPTPEALQEVFSEFEGFLALPRGERQARIAAAKSAEAQSQPIAETMPEGPPGVIASASPKKMAYLLSFERPQMIAFLVKRLPDQVKEEVLSNLPGQRGDVELILKEIKENAMTGVLEGRIVEYFAGKVA
ncbi:MAG: hypothetical protein ABIJ26_04150 [Candidatus Margulisiibacteriota bacterium]|nr:hypothetical protein [Candidatus Margulisiibacteriota bacterium]